MKQSDPIVKLIIKRTGFEIHLDGSVSSLSEQLPVLIQFADEISGKLGLPPSVAPVETELSISKNIPKAGPATDFPSIKPSKSSIANIEALFNTSWGRNQHGKADVLEALETIGAPEEGRSVSRDLLRLIKRGKIRRIKKEGQYLYFNPVAS
jgi:hypothetical protein